MTAKTDELLKSAFHLNTGRPKQSSKVNLNDKTECKPVRSFEDDNVFMDHNADNNGLLPQALGQIKKVVAAFVNKLGIPFCNKKKIE